MYVYIYIYICIHTSVLCVCMYISIICICIYIYIGLPGVRRPGGAGLRLLHHDVLSLHVAIRNITISI